MNESRIVVIGEALVDVVGGGDGATALPGGSPANVAVTLARLGRTAELVTTLADDPRGNLVRGWLEGAGVQVVAEAPASGRTSTARVVLDADGSATYDFDLSWDLTLAAMPTASLTDGCGVVHAGSIATVLEPGAATVSDVLRGARGRSLVSFDPNARPTITPDVARVRSQVERIVGWCDLVKVSAEDLHWYYPETDPVDAARKWAATGPALVVVTLGGDGAVAIRGDEITRVPGRNVAVVDTIGAGDTFMGALIDALVSADVVGAHARQRLTTLSADQLAASVSWAASAAAVTVSRPGADPPTRADLVGLL